MKQLLLLPIFFTALTIAAHAEPLPAFDSDQASDIWLRQNSPHYEMMASSVEHRLGYFIRNAADLTRGGTVKLEGGKLAIELSGSISGPERVSVLIFELTNCYQNPQHEEIDKAAVSGKISEAREFGILHELVELDGLRHHKMVLEDLERKTGTIPAEMLHWINPTLKRLSDYNLPFAFDHVKAQEAGGHTKHYHEWFPKQALKRADKAK